MNIIIFGGPGSGKGTQSDLIIKEYGLLHISTGECLRSEIKMQTELGKLAGEYVAKGALVPDELVAGIIANVLDTHPNRKGVVFDGYPRTIAQAEALNEILSKRGIKVEAVVSLEVSEEELIKRLLKRGEISGRSDDNLETIKNRLVVYENQTAPLVDYYKKAGIYFGIDGIGSIEDIFSRIKNALLPIAGK